MILPYKVKNPPKHFPTATVALIAINVLVFALTSHKFLMARREIVDAYALTLGVSPGWTVFTSVFLHGDIFHLTGNMLFLWVFGPAVEDRMRVPGYLGLYMLSGFAGHVAQVALGAAGAIGASIPTLGASGCIMGVLGAYWYMYSWSPVCMFYWIGLLWRGTFELAAIWVIGAYFVLDLTNGFIGRSLGSAGGVANFAHVGGAFVGALLVWSLGYKRDSGEVSKVKAVQAELKDPNLLSCEEMWKLVEGSPDDEELFVSYALKAARDGGPDDVRRAISMNGRAMVTNCPEAATRFLLTTPGVGGVFGPGEMVYLGKWCEQSQRSDQALTVYERMLTEHPDAPEVEQALYRVAWIQWNSLRDPRAALEKLRVLLERFPAGRLMFEAEDLRDEILRDTGGQSRAA